MQETENYLRELERHLDCPRHIRKPFLDKTRQMAEDFIQGRPDATSQEVLEFLGKPKELAQGFLETLEPEILERYHKRKKFLLYTCVAALAMALLCVSIWAVHLWNVPRHIEITETLIVEQ